MGKIYQSTLRPLMRGTIGGGKKQTSINPFPSRRDGATTHLKFAILRHRSGQNNVGNSSSRRSVTRNDRPELAACKNKNNKPSIQ